jgi:hypothetical protein
MSRLGSRPHDDRTGEPWIAGPHRIPYPGPAEYRDKARQAEIRFFDAMREKGGRIDHLRYYGGHSTGASENYVYETTNHRREATSTMSAQ